MAIKLLCNECGKQENISLSLNWGSQIEVFDELRTLLHLRVLLENKSKFSNLTLELKPLSFFPFYSIHIFIFISRISLLFKQQMCVGPICPQADSRTSEQAFFTRMTQFIRHTPTPLMDLIKILCTICGPVVIMFMACTFIQSFTLLNHVNLLFVCFSRRFITLFSSVFC